MDAASGVALVVSLVSALFAGLAWRETRKQAVASRDMVTIEQRRDAEAVERGRAARVVPRIIRELDEKGRRRSRIELINEGAAVARNTTVSLEAVEGEERNLPRFLDHAFPCDIPAGQGAGVHLSVYLGSAPRVVLVTSWTDDRGLQEERFVTPVF